MTAVSFAVAQDRATLEQNKKKVEEEISYNQSLLKSTTKDKQHSSNQVVILNNNINKREELISILNKEITAINNEINKQNAQIDSLQKSLESLRGDYAALIRVAHKTESIYSQLAFIFAAEDFNQAFLRLRYLRQLSEERRKQADRINNTQEKVKEIIDKLKVQKSEKEIALQAEKIERNKLADDKKQVNLIIQDLSKREKSIKKTLANKQQEAKKLERQIQKIIEEEIRKAAEASKAANAHTVQSGDFALTPAEMALSRDFAANRGKLPWPVEKGILSKGYGQSSPEGMPKVKTQNNGIDIMTNEGAEALAVFSGTVTSIWSIQEYHFTVMVRHGEYITVYSKLDAVYVKSGDKVTTRQPIGTVNKDASTGATEIHFQLWKGKAIQNPSLWLAPFR
jgi:septal ring factor EnvC (AmiA/AmiB activator)